MTRKRDRIFAGLGAALFLLSAVGLTALIIIDANSKTNSAATPTTADTCVDNGTEATLPVPEVYTTGAATTELQKTDLEVGTGKEAKSGDCLAVKYYGTLASDGTHFDDNFTQTTGFAFRLGTGGVIPGWDQGLVGLKEGGTRRLVIPAALAYGETGQGSIPPNADLVFVVKLLRIQ